MQEVTQLNKNHSVLTPKGVINVRLYFVFYLNKSFFIDKKYQLVKYSAQTFCDTPVHKRIKIVPITDNHAERVPELGRGVRQIRKQ